MLVHVFFGGEFLGGGEGRLNYAPVCSWPRATLL